MNMIEHDNVDTTMISLAHIGHLHSSTNALLPKPSCTAADCPPEMMQTKGLMALMAGLVCWLNVAVANAGKTVVTDTVSTVSWGQRFVASKHMKELNAFVDQWNGAPDLHSLDLFGRSGVIERQWKLSGYRSLAWDVALCPECDLTCRTGFFNLLACGLRLHENALIVGGPPCSLFIFLSSSCHKRNSEHFGIAGDPSSRPTQIANLIVNNLAVFLGLMLRRRPVFILLEQPGSSVMFQMPSLEKQFKKMIGALCIFTWLGLWGHCLPKPTKLWGNLPGMAAMKRKLTKEKREKIHDKLERAAEKARQRGLPVKQYYKKDKNGKVTGMKALGETAVYPKRFAEGLFALWQVAWVLRNQDQI